VAYLIDSDWVIDHLEGRREARELIARLLPDGIAISIITYLEIFEGILGGRDRAEAERVFREFLRGVDVIGINRAVARRTADIRVELRRQKRPVTNRAMDLLIAATALERNLIMVSRNTRDYGDIPNLRLHGTI
jgi:tRNA(fMet)-specific endonuclease VapC